MKSQTLDARSPKSYADEMGTIDGGSTDQMHTVKAAVTSNNNASSYDSLPESTKKEAQAMLQGVSIMPSPSK